MPLERALTMKDLEPMGCEMVEHCTHDHSILFLHSACHMGAGVEVEYEKATGYLRVKCNRCKRHVATLQVARGPMHEPRAI